MILLIIILLIVSAIGIYLRYAKQTLKYNPDQFKTLPEVTQALQDAGLESCNVILGIDFTQSNSYQGKHTWGSQSMHFLCPPNGPYIMNPYQQVIDVCGKTLDRLDDDNWIPTFGFGCIETKGKSCFSFTEDEPRGCWGFRGVMECYFREASERTLSGPTNFAPVIRKAIEIVRETGNEFHVLIIVCDGQVTQPKETEQAIVEACAYPLAIIIVGVGDGDQKASPGYEWSQMDMYDDGLPDRSWDNVQFVPFNRLANTQGKKLSSKEQIAFAVAAMQELPEQFKTLKKMGMIC